MEVNLRPAKVAGLLISGGRRFRAPLQKQMTNFKSDLIFAFDWSGDGKQLALARGATSSDVILISNFR